MKIIEYSPECERGLIPLLAYNRIDLAKLKNRKKSLDLEAAKEELDYYLDKKFPIYVAITEKKGIIGFTVCRVEDDVVWSELLYVIQEERQKGVGSTLFKRAEELAIKLGGTTLYNWVHPNNHRSIPFLKKQGYEVLNLIEVRKRLPGEKTTRKFKIGDYVYDY